MESGSLSRWLTLVANLGVIGGLVLLVVELDQNRELTRAQMRHELAMGIVGLLQSPADNPQLADLLYRANSGRPLTPAEWYQFNIRTNGLFRYWEDVHYQYRAGLYDDVEFQRQRDAWRASLQGSLPGQDYWCRVRSLYSPEFAREMDALSPGDCSESASSRNVDRMIRLAEEYTMAWNSRDPARVAAFFAPEGTLYVNGAANQGRAAITATAGDFMTAFPDLLLLMDGLAITAGGATYHWTFIGSNSGPGGTGNAVNFSGFEEWTLADDGLIVESQGHFDSEEYQRQVERGVDTQGSTR